MASEPVPRSSLPPRKRDRARTVLAGGLGAIAALFAVLNLDDVKVHWIVTTTRTALIIVILVSFGLGVGVGLLAARRASRKS